MPRQAKSFKPPRAPAAEDRASLGPVVQDPRLPGPASRDAGPLLAGLFDWFEAEGRRLAGRDVREPWRVLVLEVMSQQTQIERSLVAAEAFCARFPDAGALAGSTPADVIRAWAGLGYNRRALALRAAAIAIVERHDGVVPNDVNLLTTLPGVGAYTARAVAARAFGLPVAPLDVNVRRVLGRVLGEDRAGTLQLFGDELARASRAKSDNPASAADAGGSTDRGPGRFADALMDLAALLCRPRQPLCQRCPLSALCVTATANSPGGSGAPPASARRPADSSAPAFPATRRWLRGQLLRELREAPPGSWLTVEGDRGSHQDAAVRETLAALEREGFVETDGEGRARLAE